MDLENNAQYDNLDDIVIKTNLSVQYSNWFFQMIVPKLPVKKLPNFNFEYSLFDCAEHQDFTKGKTWEKILNNNKPVIFINTDIMFSILSLPKSISIKLIKVLSKSGCSGFFIS